MRKLHVVTAVATATLLPAAALADRPPNPRERAAAERALRTNGFVSWDSIELDDGRWEVDDARSRNGQKFDVKLAPGTYRIVRRVRDD